MDEETGVEMVRPMSDIPLLKGASGKETVVREFKYSDDGRATVEGGVSDQVYAGDAGEDGRGMTQAERDRFDARREGRWCGRPAAGSKWVAWSSEEGQAVTTIHPGEGGILRRCFRELS